jgi:putative flippase GtrA
VDFSLQISVAVLRQFISFGIVGVAGFVVDAGVLYCALAAGLGLYAGRIISYLTAATTTWILNRRYTFGRSSGGRSLIGEWARFVFSQLSGAAVNLSTYGLLVYFSPWVARNPVIGVAFGSIAGLLVNFVAARSYAFKVRS